MKDKKVLNDCTANKSLYDYFPKSGFDVIVVINYILYDFVL